MPLSTKEIRPIYRLIHVLLRQKKSTRFVASKKIYTFWLVKKNYTFCLYRYVWPNIL